MDKEKLETKYSELLKDSCFVVKSITSVNHKPDIFMIGLGHFPKDGSSYIKPEQAPCYNCKQPYSNHTYDTVLFLSLLRNTTKEEATGYLQSIGKQLEEDKIDGIVFVETKEKYRIGE